MNDLPSWLQAFTAIVALGISVWAVTQSGAVERRKDSMHARGIAVAIYPEIVTLKTTLEHKHEFLDTLKEKAGHLVGQSVAAEVQLAAQIPIPPMLERNVDNLFLLSGVAGPSCLQLFRLLLQYNVFVDDATQRIMVMNSKEWQKMLDLFYEHLHLIEKARAKSEHEVKPIHDSIVG